MAIFINMVNFNSSMDKPGSGWNEISYPFPHFNGATVEVWEWIRNFILHFVMDVTTYPCWD